MRAIRRVRRRRLEAGGCEEAIDAIAVEDPLEIRLVGELGGRPIERSFSVTLRTPGHDLELALGLLFAEGVIDDARDVRRLPSLRRSSQNASGREGRRPDRPDGRQQGLQKARDPGRRTMPSERIDRGGETEDHALSAGRVLRLKLVSGRLPAQVLVGRSLVASAACGACGKSNIDALRLGSRRRLAPARPRVTPALLMALPAAMRAAQRGFARTGGLHAAALFDTRGRLVVLREDVGRHNAVDKVIGERLLSRETIAGNHLLVVSGRAGFEIIQKALMAGISIVGAVGAPSSLAVDLARSAGMTLVGFLSAPSFNIYSAPERIAPMPRALSRRRTRA